MSQPPTPAQERLAAILRRLREDAGLTTYRLAELLGWSQSKVAKIENKWTRPSAEDADAWASATNASAHDREELASLINSAWTVAKSWRVSHRRGLAARQREMAQTEQTAQSISHFQPAVIPGLLQTESYARHVLRLGDVTGRGDIDAAVTARMNRQTVLLAPGRQFSYVLSEGALRWRPGPPELMGEQIERLIASSALPNVSLGLIPFDRVAAAVYEHGFAIYEMDEPFVLVENYHGEDFLADHRDLDIYRRIFKTLADSALTGDDAAAFARSLLSS